MERISIPGALLACTFSCVCLFLSICCGNSKKQKNLYPLYSSWPTCRASAINQCNLKPKKFCRSLCFLHPKYTHNINWMLQFCKTHVTLFQWLVFIVEDGVNCRRRNTVFIYRKDTCDDLKAWLKIGGGYTVKLLIWWLRVTYYLFLNQDWLASTIFSLDKYIRV